MFEIGEFIVYGHKGICKVEDITYLDMSGADKDRLYYVLLPVNTKGGKVYSPVDSGKVETRKMMTSEEATSLIDESGSGSSRPCTCAKKSGWRKGRRSRPSTSTI